MGEGVGFGGAGVGGGGGGGGALVLAQCSEARGCGSDLHWREISNKSGC